MKYRYRFNSTELLIYVVLMALEIIGIVLFITTFWFYSIVFGILLLFTLIRIVFSLIRGYKVLDNGLAILPFNYTIPYEKVTDITLKKDAVVITHKFGKREKETYLFTKELNKMYDEIVRNRRINNSENKS